MPKISDVKAVCNDLRKNSFGNTLFIRWCSEVDAYAMQNDMKEYREAYISRQKDVAVYDLPTGVVFDRIESVTIVDYPLKKLDLRSHNIEGYWLSEGKIEFYPIPAITDDTAQIRIVYIPELELYENVHATLKIEFPNDKIYQYYCLAEICIHQEDLEMADVYTMKYNEALEKYLLAKKKNGPVTTNNRITNIW